ncbi:MAG: TIGR04283 family arsenosugar biosynthesis glycosyltransferase [Proteobacteria bacterium]|nr:TIGR04283 family arsenosugar biosynthesis glycosyltransferase [Pseudomonadota bacterium]
MGELSIIIPTLNAAPHLRDSLPPLAAFEAIDLVHEVIFADGGSGDNTSEIAEATGAIHVSAKKGRGTQLAAGAAMAKGKWLLFLHADTQLAPNWHEAVRDFVELPENRGRAGYFRFQLDDDGLRAFLLARIVAWRARVLGLPYGDQALLISSDHYRQIGGFPEIPLMEDVAMVRRIGRRNLSPLKPVAVTSAERYRRDGYVLRPIRNLFCLALFFLGTPPRVIARIYG